MNSIERQRLWADAYAFRAFVAAQRSHGLLLAQCPTNEGDLYLALTTALHAQYARPFGKSDGVDSRFRFVRDDVPESVRDYHDFMSSFRHKVLCHTDANFSTEGIELNDLEVHRSDAGELSISPSDPRALRDHYRELGQLFSTMVAVSGRRLLATLRASEHFVPQSPGRYLLRLSGEDPFEKLPS